MTEREDIAETIDVQPAAVTTPAPAETAARDGELDKVRELVLRAHPDVVPDLVRGGSIDELVASVEPARSAYQRIAEQVRDVRSREGEESRSRAVRDDSTTSRLHDSSTSLVAQPPPVPAGGAATVVDPADLTPTSKIAQALAARKRK